TNRRLKALPRQRRSRVLRRVRLISAMRISAKNLFATDAFPRKSRLWHEYGRAVNPVFYPETATFHKPACQGSVAPQQPGTLYHFSMSSHIRIFGARQNNLKNLDVSFDTGTFTVITGVSGSGKSSLAFDTLYAEGQRRYVETF